MNHLVAYLSSRTPEQLATVIANRPEAQLPPRPSSLTDLAQRLGSPYLVGAVLLDLHRPELQVAEALAALGSGCGRDELAAALGVADDDPALDRAVRRLAEHAVAWPQDDRLYTVELDRIWPYPLGLGAPLTTVLDGQRADDLRRIARQLGLNPATQKSGNLRLLTEWLASGENVRRLCASAPKPTRELLDQLAWQGPYLDEPDYAFGRVPPAAKWAVEHGLLGRSGGWGEPMEMPCEVALALRGPDYRLPFDPVPPVCPSTAVNVEAIDREAAATAGTAVVRVAALLESAGRTPITLLKTGGVGVRELRRLGKLLGEDPEHVRLWLELAVAAELLGATELGLLPTEGYDTWCQQQPADQLAELLAAWLECPGMPFYQPPQGQAVPALTRFADTRSVPALRTALLTALDRLPAGSAATSVESVTALVGWLCPFTVDRMTDPGDLLRCLWREATLLGVIAHDGASGIGRALAGGAAAETLAEAARRLLPAAQETVLLQADLTAVAVGPPSARLAELLDTAADRESGGGAWTWRFSAATIRRALDAGHTADDLLAALRAAATGGRLPQPLEYLVTDVARRHGTIRVRPVACCLLSDDPALLREIRNARGLAKLGLTVLAPTVLASAVPAAETLAALRAAGYAPAAENPDGTVAVERAPRQRARRLPDQLDGGTTLRDIPDELLDELLAMHGGQLPQQLLGAVALAGDGVAPAKLADPGELARKLLGVDGPKSKPKSKPKPRRTS